MKNQFKKGDEVYFALYPYDEKNKRWTGFESIGIFECIIEEIIDVPRANKSVTTMIKVKDIETGVEFHAEENYLFSKNEETRESVEKIVVNTFIKDMQQYYNEIQLALNNVLDAGIKLEQLENIGQ